MATWLKFAEQETTQIIVLLLFLSLPFSPFHDSLLHFVPSPSLSLSLFLSLHFILQSDVRNHTFVWNEANSARDRVEESISHHHIFFFSKDKQIVKKIYFQRERA